MDNINYILSLIDWNNTLDQQAAGIKIAVAMIIVNAETEHKTAPARIFFGNAVPAEERSDAVRRAFYEKTKLRRNLISRKTAVGRTHKAAVRCNRAHLRLYLPPEKLVERAVFTRHIFAHVNTV